jgi:hypothetical protein
VEPILQLRDDEGDSLPGRRSRQGSGSEVRGQRSVRNEQSICGIFCKEQDESGDIVGSS